MIRFLFFLLIFLAPFKAFSEVSVAFFEMHDHRGQLVRLEEGGRFYHVAISTEKGWLHVSPQDGVEVFESLDQVPLKRVVLTNKSLRSLSLEDIDPYLGLPFDYTYTWSLKDSTYCSKLIAQLLKIQPLPMSFSSSHWKPAFLPSRQGKGLSPDDLYQILKMKHFTEQESSSSCSPFLIN